MESIESVTEFTSKQAYWVAELKASMKMLKSWHKLADKVNRLYTARLPDPESPDRFMLNLFNSNTSTLEAMLYGSSPTIDVSRRFNDPDDDAGRVAAVIMERLLNLDLAENGEEIDCLLRSVLQDRLLPGLGCARVRYEVETETTTDPMTGEPIEQLVSEDAPVDYYYWGDVLWSWSRNFAGLRWIAYRNYMTKDQVAERFGEDVAETIKLRSQMPDISEDGERDPDMENVWKQAEIWEIWDKTGRKVCWVELDAEDLLDSKPDPLQLRGFFPSPPFLMANPTTTLYMPTPDYKLSQDIYNEIDILQTRISVISEAVKFVGLYDAGSGDLQRLLKEGTDNQLIPVDNWALFAEKGGIKGAVDWLPLDMVVSALSILKDIRNDYIQLLQQLTGMSDIMRGQLDNQYEGVGQSDQKVKFGSIRIQALQEQFARFASDLMQLKAEVISRHFSPETILTRANIQPTLGDPDEIVQAMELIKDPAKAKLRVNIRPESIAMADYAQLQQERTAYLTAVGTYMQSAAGLIAIDPRAKPFLLQLLQWGLAGYRGADSIEGVIDRAIEATSAEAEQAQNKPDPEQIKAQAEMAKIQAKSEADQALRRLDAQADGELVMAQHQTKLQQIQADMEAALTETRAKMEADVLKERAQAFYNSQQTAMAASAEIEKDTIAHQLDIEKEMVKAATSIDTMAAQARAKIAEQREVLRTRRLAESSDNDDKAEG